MGALWLIPPACLSVEHRLCPPPGPLCVWSRVRMAGTVDGPVAPLLARSWGVEVWEAKARSRPLCGSCHWNEWGLGWGDSVRWEGAGICPIGSALLSRGPVYLESLMGDATDG